MKNLKLLAALVPLLATLACTDAAKAPAEAAMKAAETALGQLGGEVAKYAPDKAKEAQEAFAMAKDKIAKEDFKGALATATEIPNQVKAALAAAAAKKEELLKAYTAASAGLPKMVEALKSRLDVLSQSKKLPKGLDKAALDKAKDGLAGVEKAVAALADQAKTGQVAEATAQAAAIKAKATEIMQSIGMTVP